MDNMLNTPENLDAMSKEMRSSAVKTFRGIDETLNTNGVYKLVLKGADKYAVSRMREYMDKTDEVTLFVATASEQSGGKSTASNVILNYPLLPEAKTATTACATEIRYGEEPSVQIMYYAKPQGAEEFTEGPLFHYDSTHRIDKGIWHDLKIFIYRCVTDQVIFLETLQYFSKIHIETDHPGDFGIDDIDMSPNDPRHVVLLLLFLFSTYIGQNDEVELPNRVALCKFREELMRKLGVNPDRDFVVLVRWNEDTLKQGLVLVDLPGLGSSAGEKIKPNGTVRRSHNRISIEYMNKVDSVFLFFTPTAAGDSAKKVLEAFLATERMKQNVALKENRIIPIMNKADEASAIQTELNAVRASLGELNPSFICPISALSGEYQFVSDGWLPIQRTKRYNSKKNGREAIYKKYLRRRGHEPSEEYICGEIYEALEDAYNEAYSFTDVNGNEYNITLEQWVKMMTTDYLARLRALKTLEMLHIGMYAERQLVANIDMRISALLMVHQGGGDMGKELAGQVKNLVVDKLDTVVMDIETQLADLKSDISDVLQKRHDDLVNAYTGKVRMIESKIAEIIKLAADSLESDGWGDYPIDPDDKYFEGGKKIARHNRDVINKLIDDVKSVDVPSYLREAENVLSDILHDVSRKYANVRDNFLNGVYGLLASQVEQKMNEAYAEALQKYGNGDHGVSFDMFYKALFEQLKASIIKKIQGFADMANSIIKGDTEVADALSSVINAASSLSLQLQGWYKDSEDSYLTSLKRHTFFCGDAVFDRDALKVQADIPFFAPNAAKLWADTTVTTLADMSIDRIPEAFDKFSADVSVLNQAGMKGTLDVIDDIITPNIQHGQTEVKKEIETLNAGLSEIRTKINAMFTEINHTLEVLRGCDWSADEVKVIEALYHDISSDSGR